MRCRVTITQVNHLHMYLTANKRPLMLASLVSHACKFTDAIHVYHKPQNLQKVAQE